MKNTLPIPAQKVQNAIIEYGYAFTVIESDVPTHTAQQAAEKVGCKLGQIVKSIIFKGSVSGKPILVLTSGENRVNEELISKEIGESINRADPEFVKQSTGFPIGGVPPIAHSTPVKVFIDKDLMKYETIWAAAGTPNSLFELTPIALETMTSGKIIQVK